MTVKTPYFSIIIPTYNRKLYLKKAIDSVLKQTFKDFELIIIDDGSTDDTESLISSYNDSRIIYEFQTNHGVAHARNRGLEKAKAYWILFLDSDDWWLKNKLQRAKDYIDQYSGIKVFHTEEVWYRKGEVLNQKKKHDKPEGFVYLNALGLCCISISTVAIDRTLFEDIGTFDESLLACEDYDFWLRATSRYPVKLIPEYLTEKEGGRPDQLSSQWGLDRYRILALSKMLKSDQLTPDYYDQTLNELIKKANVYVKGCEKRGKEEEALHYKKLIDQFSLPV